jgi:hypothetical protein
MSSAVFPWQGRRPLLARATRQVSFLLLFAALACLTGCPGGGPGDAKNSVSGKVTLNGQPVSGMVGFIGSDGKEVPAPIKPDGTYIVDNPPTGDVKVVVRGMQGPSLPKGVTMQDMGGPQGVQPPPKYASPATSGLTFNVTGGKQNYNIELTP